MWKFQAPTTNILLHYLDLYSFLTDKYIVNTVSEINILLSRDKEFVRQWDKV